MNVLKAKIKQTRLELVPEAIGHNDELSIDQNSPCWHLQRRIRITASVAKSFFTAKNLNRIVNEHLWKTTDLSNIQAIQYAAETTK